MLRLVRSEWMKLRRTVIWIVAAASPLLAGVVGYAGTRGTDGEGAEWMSALALMAALHAMLFLPLLTGVFAALLCRFEHAGGGWKQLLALPVSRTQLFAVKYMYVMFLLLLTQLLFLAALLGVGAALGFQGPVPWLAILRSVGGGWVACLPLAALQLGVSTALPSFAAPLAVNVVLTMPNLLVMNSSTYGPYYPWAQPLLAMIPMEGHGMAAINLSATTLFGVILGSFVVFLTAGWAYFMRKPV
ncbi:ABC transporter permease [Paenibacillus methanolicus]|uniref:ABC-2 type transport system permease protein n=1 Tax=Paenibacillus methanolicus TaxID=582686 RepID=A0A5S5CAG7_9BACL|nr:ABC transporter permease [Paenibacillus methanolicus]TYP75618.1 hypothetical protein BCM02_104298 [Paenibacillus methanolicus]